jgi:hypothetical protein
LKNQAFKLLAETEMGMKNFVCKVYFAPDDLRFSFSAKQNEHKIRVFQAIYGGLRVRTPSPWVAKNAKKWLRLPRHTNLILTLVNLKVLGLFRKA